jgi:hypothetical protein
VDNENILAISIPNAISITLMALVGGFVLAGVRKLAMGRMNAAGSAQSNVPGR